MGEEDYEIKLRGIAVVVVGCVAIVELGGGGMKQQAKKLVSIDEAALEEHSSNAGDGSSFNITKFPGR